MKKEAAIALSLANLCFIREWSVILKRSNWFSINANLIPLHLAALVLNVLALAGAAYLGVALARTSRNGSAMAFARWAFLGMLIVVLNVAREMSGLNYSDFLFSHIGYWKFILDYDWPFVAARFALCAAVVWGLFQRRIRTVRIAVTGIVAFGALILPPFVTEPVLFSSLVLLIFLQWRDRVIRIAARTLLVLSPFVLVTFSQAAWGLASIRSILRNKPAVKAALAKEVSKVRVLWLIFDEMDQRLTYAARPPGLELPELDRLRAESLYAANAYSPANSTYVSLPSLLTGQLVSKSDLFPSEMLITWERTGRKVKLSEQTSIFSEAVKAGHNAAIVSETENWQLIFEPQTTVKFKDNFTVEAPGREIVRIMANQTSGLWPAWSSSRQKVSLNLISDQSTVNSFKNNLHNAKICLQTPDLGFCFVYFILPHDPYIYDRATGEFVYDYIDTPQGYLDNLALVDRTLGELRSAMTQAGTWDATTVILSSDHHWRKSKDFDGKLYERWVPFVVKFAGQKEGSVYERRFQTLCTHDMVLALLGGEISDPRGLARWLDKRRVSP